jgi:hypothetical protein
MRQALAAWGRELERVIGRGRGHGRGARWVTPGARWRWGAQGRRPEDHDDARSRGATSGRQRSAGPCAARTWCPCGGSRENPSPGGRRGARRPWRAGPLAGRAEPPRSQRSGWLSWPSRSDRRRGSVDPAGLGPRPWRSNALKPQSALRALDRGAARRPPAGHLGSDVRQMRAAGVATTGGEDRSRRSRSRLRYPQREHAASRRRRCHGSRRNDGWRDPGGRHRELLGPDGSRRGRHTPRSEPSARN